MEDIFSQHISHIVFISVFPLPSFLFQPEVHFFFANGSQFEFVIDILLMPWPTAAGDGENHIKLTASHNDMCRFDPPVYNTGHK